MFGIGYDIVNGAASQIAMPIIATSAYYAAKNQGFAPHYGALISAVVLHMAVDLLWPMYYQDSKIEDTSHAILMQATHVVVQGMAQAAHITCALNTQPSDNASPVALRAKLLMLIPLTVSTANALSYIASQYDNSEDEISLLNTETKIKLHIGSVVKFAAQLAVISTPAKDFPMIVGFAGHAMRGVLYECLESRHESVESSDMLDIFSEGLVGAAGSGAFSLLAPDMNSVTRLYLTLSITESLENAVRLIMQNSDIVLKAVTHMCDDAIEQSHYAIASAHEIEQ